MVPNCLLHVTCRVVCLSNNQGDRPIGHQSGPVTSWSVSVNWLWARQITLDDTIINLQRRRAPPPPPPQTTCGSGRTTVSSFKQQTWMMVSEQKLCKFMFPLKSTQNQYKVKELHLYYLFISLNKRKNFFCVCCQLYFLERKWPTIYIYVKSCPACSPRVQVQDFNIWRDHFFNYYSD